MKSIITALTVILISSIALAGAMKLEPASATQECMSLIANGNKFPSGVDMIVASGSELSLTDGKFTILEERGDQVQVWNNNIQATIQGHSCITQSGNANSRVAGWLRNSSSRYNETRFRTPEVAGTMIDSPAAQAQAQSWIEARRKLEATLRSCARQEVENPEIRAAAREALAVFDSGTTPAGTRYQR